MSNTVEESKVEFRQQLITILRQQFKLNQFRPGQLEALETLFKEKRLLCIQPTGHGKSLLYQLPSVLLPGITIVISPLLALMRDQVQQLQSRFSISAGSINSDQEDEENFDVQQRARKGELKILFVAPEKLDNLDYLDFLLQLPISLLVIDEAHCVSTWGHDFRPSYRQIVRFAAEVEKQNKDLRLLALTATANQKTEKDIRQQLLVGDKKVLVRRQSMARPNISLSVVKTNGLAEKLLACQQLLKYLPGVGLIYCATRENTEIVAEFLQQKGLNAVAYHAGLSPEKKRELQHAFLNNCYQVMSATNALGMGIDKQDLRYIIHFDIPGSITAYYQEVGRCGRDGKAAQGVLLFDLNDKKIQQYFIDSAQPHCEDFVAVQSFITQAESAPILTEIKRGTGLHPTRLQVVVAELVEQGFIEKVKEAKRQVYRVTQKQSEVDLARYQNQLQVREGELAEMLRYANSVTDCLMSLLRQALGDVEVESCGHCAICRKSMQEFVVDGAAYQQVTQWLSERTVDINLSRAANVATGVSLLDGKLRSTMFVNFMRARAQENTAIDEQLRKFLLSQLKRLQQQYNFSALVVIPSRTWQGRQLFFELISRELNIPCLSNCLAWQVEPELRQGELLNNDQRRHNVAKKMTCRKSVDLNRGDILLFDDYIGSGATMREAVRALRNDAKTKATIIPFTIASIRWRLGRRGMI